MTTSLEFTPAIQEALNYERYHHPVPLVQRRMEVLWLKSHGFPHTPIAQLAGVAENTMRDYFRLYEEGGLEKLKEVQVHHPASALEAYHPSLEAYFRANPPASIKEAQSELEALTGIKRSETQVREFLKKNSLCVAAALG
jgi:transposase